jgi:hypothetical protein
MKKTCWEIVAVGMSYFVLFLFTHVVPEFLCLLLSVVLFVVLTVMLLVALTVGFVKWRKSSRLWPVPALVCLAFILSAYFTPPIGKFISDWRFEKHLAEYSRVVDGLRNGSIRCDAPCKATSGGVGPASQAAHLRVLEWSRCNDGGIFVSFFVPIDVPLVHIGYLFKGYGENSDCIAAAATLEKSFLYIRHVTGRWYHFSDQPDL